MGGNMVGALLKMIVAFALVAICVGMPPLGFVIVGTIAIARMLR